MILSGILFCLFVRFIDDLYAGLFMGSQTPSSSHFMDKLLNYFVLGVFLVMKMFSVCSDQLPT